MQEKIKLTTFEEPLTEAEIAVLTEKYTSQRAFFQRFYYIFGMVFSLIILIVFYAAISQPDEGIYSRIIEKQRTIYYAQYMIPGILLFFTAVCASHFTIAVGGLKKDLKERIKIIEYVVVKRKKIMPSDHSYHFYIISNFKTHLQVSKAVYELYQINDQLTIEYAPHSKTFLAYY